MNKIALNTYHLTVTDKAKKGHSLVTATRTTDGVAIVGTPEPAAVLALETAATGLETARDARTLKVNQAEAATKTQTAAEQALDTAFTNFVAMATPKVGDDAAKIKTLGLDVAGETAHTASSTRPENLSASTGDLNGTVDLHCNRNKDAKSYVWQKTSDPAATTGWETAGITTKSSFTATGLLSGTKYWFRVGVIVTGAVNPGPWSDPAQQMAP